MNYRTNEDKLGCGDSLYQDNRLIDLLITEEEPVTEPVTLDEVKANLAITFNEDDALLTLLIKACRQHLEKYTCLSFFPKTVRVILEVRDRMELPYGPVTSITASKNSEEEALDIADVKATGIQFKSVGPGYWDLTYTAGYENLPNDLKQAIIQDVSWNYQNRGDLNGDVLFSQQAKIMARPHRRVPSVL